MGKLKSNTVNGDTKNSNCKLHGDTKHTYRDDRWRCNKCLCVAVQKRRDKIKLMSIEYKGGKCVMCGYSKCIAALEFHHIDSKSKDYGISAKGYTKSWDSIRVELDKCIMVCSNCHMEIHHMEHEQYKHKIEYSINPLEKPKCKECGIEISEKRCNYCVSCSNIKRRTVERPTYDNLMIDINKLGYKATGKKYNVSDSSIRKWKKIYEKEK